MSIGSAVSPLVGWLTLRTYRKCRWGSDREEEKSVIHRLISLSQIRYVRVQPSVLVERFAYCTKVEPERFDLKRMPSLRCHVLTP